jgi:hypothetical protein
MRLKPLLLVVGGLASVGLLTRTSVSAFAGGWVPLVGSTDGGVAVGLLWLLVIVPGLVSVLAAVTMVVVLAPLLVRAPRRPTQDRPESAVPVPSEMASAA